MSIFLAIYHAIPLKVKAVFWLLVAVAVLPHPTIPFWPALIVMGLVGVGTLALVAVLYKNGNYISPIEEDEVEPERRDTVPIYIDPAED